MNREFKFRVWNGKEMFNDNAILRKNGEFIAGFWDWEETEIVEPYPNCIFMQYTGIRDKNGKEIYEGDIVKIHETAYSLNNVQRQMRNGIDVDVSEYVGVITWDNEGAEYCCVEKGSTVDDSAGWPRHEQDHEVIGNIYENPELLNQKQDE